MRRNLKLHIRVDNIHMMGTVSQISDIDLSSCFIKCKNSSKKKINQNFPFLLYKIKTMPFIE